MPLLLASPLASDLLLPLRRLHSPPRSTQIRPSSSAASTSSAALIVVSPPSARGLPPPSSPSPPYIGFTAMIRAWSRDCNPVTPTSPTPASLPPHPSKANRRREYSLRRFREEDDRVRNSTKKGLKDALLKVWNQTADMQFLEVESNIFQISFPDEPKRDHVVNHGPWLFEKSLFAMTQWHEKIVLDPKTFTTSAFWVQIYKLPLQYRDPAAVEQIGERIDVVIESNSGFATEGIEQRKYMRVKVEISLRSPLMRGLCLEMDEKSNLWVIFKNERLPSFCFYRGQLDHEEVACLSKAYDRKAGIKKPYSYGV
ncbi:hypothetical protein Scep_004679 [Stephania cephalantha]|uniref:DUF4283 domain-containing protein n=1 Tax=Stephania cephalantha TaxID=152367 RepID=A0AAP0KTT4_9MAGN